MPPLIPHKIIDGVEYKHCTLCNEYLPLNQFHKQNGSADGLRFACKECRKKETPEQRELRLEVKKIYRIAHRQEINDKANKYQSENKELISERRSKSRKNNLEYHRKKGRENYHKHRKAYQKLHRDYVKSNPEKMNILNSKRSARKKSLLNNFTHKQWEECKEYFNNTCVYCGEQGKKLEKEHFIPLSRNGEFTKSNVLCACRKCNLSKHDQYFFEWYPRQPFYSKEREQKILDYLNYNPKTHIQQLTLTI